MNSRYRKYLLSDEWGAIRNDLYAKRGKKCERCGSASKVQVHHLTYKNIFKEEPEDLEILCAGCHKSEHFKKKSKFKGKLSAKQSLIRKVLLKKKRK